MKTVLIGIFCLMVYFSYAQKYDALWQLNDTSIFDMYQNPPKKIKLPYKMDSLFFDSNISVSDKDGKFLFMIKEAKIYNKFGEKIYLGYFTIGYILPVPETENQFFIFSGGAVSGSTNSYIHIDFNKNNGHGAIISEKKYMPDNYEFYLKSATYHRNGKDIWLLCGFNSGNVIGRVYLITKNGVARYVENNLSAPNSCFSLTGNKCALVYQDFNNQRIELHHFNNLTGEFKLARTFYFTQILNNSYQNPLDIEIDKRARFFYLTVDVIDSATFKSKYVIFYQIDLCNPNSIINNAHVIFKSSEAIGSLFFYLRLYKKPLDKLYLAIDSVHAYSDIRSTKMMVVNNPSEKGIKCNFTQSAIHDLNGYNVSNYPIPTIEDDSTKAYYDQEKSLCKGKSITLNSPAAMEKYIWNTGESMASIAVNKAGTYWCAYTQCFSTDTVRFTVTEKEVVNLSLPDAHTICEGSTAVLNPGKSTQYTWQDGDTNAVYNVTKEGVYSVKAGNECGFSSASTSIKFQKTIFANILTANEDGKNDALQLIEGTFMQNGSIEIYNRWGAKVYQSDNYQGEWKANDVSEGIYYYNYKGCNLLKGWVEVVK